MIYRLKLNLRGKGVVALFYGDIMHQLGFDGPRHTKVNPRARFYFTEKGWELYGRQVQSLATKQGFDPRVERRKNPKRSQIVYEDAYQVAILPDF